MLKNILFFLFLALEPVFIQYNLFNYDSFCNITAYIIFFQSLLIIGLILTFNKKIISFAFILEAVIFSTLLVWHHFFKEPLSYKVILLQFNEGLHFIKTSPEALLQPSILCICAVTVLKLIYLHKFFTSLPLQNTLRVIFITPLFIFFIMMQKNIFNEIFLSNDFRIYAKQFGYLAAWDYEFTTNYNYSKLYHDIVETSNIKTPARPKELQNLRLPDNIFLIQTESLDYAGFITKDIMPFLNSLKDKSAFYHIKSRSQHCSANVDLTISTNAANYDNMLYSSYNILKDIDYSKVNTLAKKSRKLGYNSSFFHGFHKTFYNRISHIPFHGYNNFWFMEDMNLNKTPLLWGYQDQDVFEFVLAQNKHHERNFNFIITLSSHSDFEIGKIHKKPYTSPQNEKERYLNSLNYVDNAFKYLIENSPADSMFIIYSDHSSEVLDDTSTLMMIYSKSQNLNSAKKIRFTDIPIIIHSLFDHTK